MVRRAKAQNAAERAKEQNGVESRSAKCCGEQKSKMVRRAKAQNAAESRIVRRAQELTNVVAVRPTEG
jgi:hypothetical protein|eukprot:COSAG02_NODE_660_length_18763_cov_116.476425_6_plen_68_part_00